MSVTATAAPIYQAEETDEKMQRARAFYESKLKAKLEPEFNNQFIAIEPDTEAYAIADSSGNAMREMHKTHPSKPLLLMKIGPEPETELAIRILGAEALAKIQNSQANLLQPCHEWHG